MRFPYVISPNTRIAYDPSPGAVELLGEISRRVFPENLEWGNEHCPSLVTFCIQSVSQTFTIKPDLDKLTGADRDNLLEILQTDLPLELVIPLIGDEIYWQRRYGDTFGVVTQRLYKNWTWKSIFIERHIQKLVEEALPQDKDEDNMGDICKLCSPYVRRLIITQLQAWKPPLGWDKEDIPEVYPVDHISLEPILLNLPNVEELDVMYGVSHVGETYNANMFVVSVLDCKRLANAILSLRNIKILKLHRSKIENSHAQALMQGLIKNTTLIELDLSHCCIEDQGALCIAKVMTVHPTLEILNLCDNKIREIGGKGIGFAMLEESCCPLVRLDLRMNPLEHGGTMGILRSLVRGDKPKELSLAGCLFGDDTPIRIAQMINLNRSLEVLDVSNNWFAEDGGQAVLNSLKNNKVLKWLDMRETDVPPIMRAMIRKLLERNRSGKDEIEEVEDEEQEQEGEGEGEEVEANENTEPEVPEVETPQAAPVNEQGNAEAVATEANT